MSGWCDTCFCFRDVRRSIVAIGMLSGGCALIEIFITIAEFSGMSEEGKVQMTPDSKEVRTYQLYIALACFNFVVFIFSFLLGYGNERSDEMLSRNYFLPWAIFIPFYVVFETGVNIHYFYYQFNGKYEKPLGSGSKLGYMIIPLVYWIVKDILLFISFVFMVIRIQHLLPRVDYVKQIEPCHECVYAPAPSPSIIQYAYAPVPVQPRIALPQPPSIPRLAPPRCSSCSGGICSAGNCNVPQQYGLASFNTRPGFSAGI